LQQILAEKTVFSAHKGQRNLAKSDLAVGFGTPFWGRRCRKGSAMVPFERTIVVSYRLSIVTTALSLTIRPQIAIEYLRRSN